MSEWKNYQRLSVPSEMRPYQPGEDLPGVSISDADRQEGCPQEGDMIARNPSDPSDQWLVNADYFEAKFESEPVADLDGNWQNFERKPIPSEMRPYEAGEELPGVSISDADKENGSPKPGDMIARNPENHDDQWLVNGEYFEAKFDTTPIEDQVEEEAEEDSPGMD